jgi:adenosylhomocysteinase
MEWAFQSMPVLRSIRKQFIKSQSLAGMRIVACLHATTETANLMMTLRDGGALPVLCPASEESSQKDVAASLELDYGVPVIPLAEALERHPHLLIDSGAQLAELWKNQEATSVMGSTESNSTGVIRLKAMAKGGTLRYPVIAVNDAMTKHLFDNRYGTGQSTMDGILRATNILLAGMNVVVAGYGWCGRGVASRARGMGANVIVCEVDPIKALEALMDGYRVMSMNDAASIGDVFVTVTGNRAVIHRDHFDKLKNGAILCNSGHFDVEIDLEGLGRVSSGKRQTREYVEEYSMRDGRKIYVLSEGRLVNLSSGDGHPAAVMDMSFANQALSVEYLVKNHSSLDKKVYAVPDLLDRQVARLKLEAMGIIIDRLSAEQENYLSGWSEEA